MMRSRYGLERSSQSESEEAVAADYVYTGKEYDSETGLIYFGGRYYAPELGRWITPDPLFLEKEPSGIIEVPKELNLYAYVQGNPVTYRDLNGFRTDAGLENGKWYGDFGMMNDSAMSPQGREMVKKWTYGTFEGSQVGAGFGLKWKTKMGPLGINAGIDSLSGGRVESQGIEPFMEDSAKVEIDFFMIRINAEITDEGFDVSAKYIEDWFSIDNMGKLESGGTIIDPNTGYAVNAELHINASGVRDMIEDVISE